MLNAVTVFANGTIISPVGQVKADLVIEGKKIKAIRDSGRIVPGETVIDCDGLFIGPGLVDIHVHGGAGNDFVTADKDEIIRGVDYHLGQGTTSIVPTCLSVPFSEIEKSISAAREAQKSSEASILGYHVEGVYIDMENRGGHLKEHVHCPDKNEYEPLIEKHADFIREWTLAPELPGALDLIRKCNANGIVTSVGHSRASYEQMMDAIDAGLSHSTHFACVMGNLQFAALRNSTGKGYAPGVVETVLLDDRVTTEVIADGFHLHKGIIELAVKCKGIYGVCLVSDSLKGVGMRDGEYLIGDQVTVVKGGIAIIKDRPSVIASSVTPLIGMMKFVNREAGISLWDSWTMASLTPAFVIHQDATKGSLAIGKDADILVIDDEFSVKYVYAMGREI